jgi:hypothetical protein
LGTDENPRARWIRYAEILPVLPRRVERSIPRDDEEMSYDAA